MNRMMLSIAAAALTLPTIASAAPKPADAPTEAMSQNTETKAKPRRYCVVQTPTGSRLEHRDCRTLDAWLAEGFDPRVK